MSGSMPGPECAGCQKPIRERFLLKALDQLWHEDCLKCACCDCRLGEVGSTLFTKANLILCKRDYLSQEAVEVFTAKATQGEGCREEGGPHVAKEGSPRTVSPEIVLRATLTVPQQQKVKEDAAAGRKEPLLRSASQLSATTDSTDSTSKGPGNANISEAASYVTAESTPKSNPNDSERSSAFQTAQELGALRGPWYVMLQDKSHKPAEKQKQSRREDAGKVVKTELFSWRSRDWIQYSIIASVIKDHYGVSDTVISWTSLLYLIGYMTLAFPSAWILDNMGLRITVLIGAVGTALGACIKTFAVKPGQFTLVLVGQAFPAFAQAFILGVPPRLSSAWFKYEELSTACSMGVLGNNLGIALGFVIPPNVVHVEDVETSLLYLCGSVGLASCLCFVVILLAFDDKPKKPPSFSEMLNRRRTRRQSFSATFSALLMDGNFWLLMVSYGLNTGAFYSVSTLLNPVILVYFPGEETFAGWLGLALIVSGLVGSWLCGLTLDRTGKYKEVTLLTYILATVGLFIYTFILSVRSHWLSLLGCIFLGFFMTGYIPIGLQLAAEITYPTPEGISSNLMNVSAQAVGFVMILVSSMVQDAYGDVVSNVCLSALLVVGCIMTVQTKAELRRQQAYKLEAARRSFSTLPSVVEKTAEVIASSPEDQPIQSTLTESDKRTPVDEKPRSTSAQVIPSGSGPVTGNAPTAVGQETEPKLEDGTHKKVLLVSASNDTSVDVALAAPGGPYSGSNVRGLENRESSSPATEGEAASPVSSQIQFRPVSPHSETRRELLRSKGGEEHGATTPCKASAAGRFTTSVSSAFRDIVVMATTRRFFMLTIFCVATTMPAFQWLQYSIVSNIVEQYYHAGSTAVSWTAMVFYAAYVTMALPCAWILENYGLRITILCGACFSAIGSCIKLFSVDPDRFAYVLIGQAFPALATAFTAAVPARLASAWFKYEEISKATSVGILGVQLGSALGFVVPPHVLHKADVQGSLSSLCMGVAIASCLAFLVVIAFFEDKPVHPPSFSEMLNRYGHKRTTFGEDMRTLMKDRNFIFLLLSYGINTGSYYSISTTLNPVITNYFPGEAKFAGILGLCMIVSGLLGSWVGGVVVDKTQMFKGVTLATYVLTTMALLLHTFVLLERSHSLTLIACVILGFFLTGYMSLGVELAAEITYPLNEALPASVLSMSAQGTGLVLTHIFEIVRVQFGTVAANLVLTGMLVLGCFLTVMLHAELKRQEAFKREQRKRSESGGARDFSEEFKAENEHGEDNGPSL
ncbi:hypothetical protein HPB52_022639 [Rhipicephalus sanguineus]|uniref:Major facilitator superfamily (MFS) profile domain-containing protein n=1 Tax=Rhipicephalus sanguineus TaxID=34632 RepID=A0A9D4T4V5_RHISA|nr:hypothetical protein HPB52_022639 [Rhipicephalus sanguineus]